MRDLRVRWALEEAGLRYEPRLIGFEDQSTDGYRALQPFGQVPAFEEDDLVLFESGAIVLHIAERTGALMPRDEANQARVKTWMFAALNTVEPPIMFLNEIESSPDDEAVKQPRRASVFQAINKRLGPVSDHLARREYLVDRFSAADLLMTSVLRILRHTDLVSKRPTLDAYRQRCEARPAFQKALADHMAPFAVHAPPNA